MLAQRRAKQNRITCAELLFSIIIAECVACGAGRIVDIGPISVRYILFGLAFVYMFIAGYKNISVNNSVIINLFVLYVFIFGLSVLRGLLLNPIGNVLAHCKGYLYIGLFIPMLFYLNNTRKVVRLFKVADVAAVLLSWLTVGVFVYTVIKGYDSTLNGLLMDKEMGHIAMVGLIPRVFMKGVPFCAIFFVYRMINIIYGNVKKRKIIYFVNTLACLLATIVSLTMGIWLAFAVGMVVLLFLLPKSKAKKLILILAPIALVILLLFGKQIIGILMKRTSEDDSSLIIKAQQMQQMLQMWTEYPLFGRGFGEVMIFDSSLAHREMLTIENFWMESLVTIGLVGTLAFVSLLLAICYNSVKAAKHVKDTRERAVLKAIPIGIIIIAVVSFFNPFINNPIGLSFLTMSAASVHLYVRKRVREKSCVRCISENKCNSSSI